MLDFGIIGKKGSGKSYLCDYLIKNANLSVDEQLKGSEVIRIKMAGVLKSMIHNVLFNLGYSYDTCQRMIEGDLKEVEVKELGVSPRHMMQTLGTEWGRDCVNEGLWGKLFSKHCFDEQSNKNYVICDDVRFDNEVYTAADNRLKLIKIITEDSQLTKDTHRSEQMPDNSCVNMLWLNDKEEITISVEEIQNSLRDAEQLNSIVILYKNKLTTVNIPKQNEYTFYELVEMWRQEELPF